MKETDLHHVWASALLRNFTLISTSGEEIRIIDPGAHNQHSGPDFFNATIMIGKVRWTGNVEIHHNSGDWLAHGHENQKAYNNVILHVVYFDNVKNLGMPTLELARYIGEDEILRISNLQQGKLSKVQFPYTGKESYSAILVAYALSRLQRKAELVKSYYERSGSDWQEVFYLLLCRNIGFQVNAIPFEWMAISTPLRKVRFHFGEIDNMEAIFFGQSGLLKAARQRGLYEMNLWYRYERMKLKYGFKPIETTSWKFMRLRPNNFPTIRISQLSAILSENFSSLIEMAIAGDIPGIYECLINAKASPFWRSHYTFERVSQNSEKKVGAASANNILINTILPFRHSFFMKKGSRKIDDESLSLLASIFPEANRVTRKWARNGLEAKTALDSQALIELDSEQEKIKMVKFGLI